MTILCGGFGRATALCALIGAVAACGVDGGGLDVEATSHTEQALVFGQSCASGAAGAGALLLEGRANFGGGLEDIHTVVCSLVLIRPDVALTAAHCINLQALGATFVADAEFFATFEPDVRGIIESNAPFPADATRVRAWVLHPSFDASTFSEASGLSEEGDLAVLFLEEARTDVSLPNLDANADAIGLGTQLSLAGYGTTEAATSSDQADGIGRLRCVNSFVNATTASEFQVGSGATTGRRCYGDSGGPTYLRSAPGTLVGIGSRAWSTDDGCTVGSVDVRVDFFSDFIEATLTSACEDGGPRLDCGIPGQPVDAGEADGGASDAGPSLIQDAGRWDGGTSEQLDASCAVDAGELLMDCGVPEPSQDAGEATGEGDAGRDAGNSEPMPDGGQPVDDAGNSGTSDTPPSPTCSCVLGDSQTSAPWGLSALLLLLFERRRRRRSYCRSGVVAEPRPSAPYSGPVFD